MARRTRRKSRKSKSSRRQRGGAGVAQHAGDVEAAKPNTVGEEGMEHKVNEQEGGRRKRKTKGRKAKRKTKKKRGKKRKLNPYFKLMLAAKKKGADSFKYKGRTYKGKKHPRLGMIYKKA